MFAVELQNIIETAKSESQYPIGEVHNMPGAPGFTVCVFKAERVPCGTPLFTHPPLSSDTVKDAERYRFMRDNDDVLSELGMIDEKALDDWIDEAMKAES